MGTFSIITILLVAHSERERAQVNQACKIYRGVGGKLELVAVNGVTVKKMKKKKRGLTEVVCEG